MKNLLAMASTAVVCLALSSAATAGTVSVYSLSGSQPGIGHDPDKAAPTVTSQGFYAKGSSNGGTNGDYNSVRFTPAALGMANLTLGQILSVSYDAKTNIAGLKDWRFKVYTEDQDGAGGNWYGARIEAPTTSSGLSFQTHNLTSYDRFTIPGTTDVYGAAAAAAAAGVANQKVMFFDISAGAKNGGYDYDTYLNNITISANTVDGIETTTLTAAVVPLPPAVFAGAALFGGMALKRRFSARTASKTA